MDKNPLNSSKQIKDMLPEWTDQCEKRLEELQARYNRRCAMNLAQRIEFTLLTMKSSGNNESMEVSDVSDFESDYFPDSQAKAYSDLSRKRVQEWERYTTFESVVRKYNPTFRL